jgi:hypothetical protein
MKELSIKMVKFVGAGDAAATRADGTNAWGEVVNQQAFDAGRCQAEGWFSLACFDYVMKYGGLMN